MPTAFVLSGGGAQGAVQVGMLQALADREIHPDLLVGTSAGALNAAYIAGHGHSARSTEDLALIWCSIPRHRILHLDPRHALLALLGKRPSIFDADRLGTLVAENLAFPRLEELPIPLSIVASDLLTGHEVVLNRGPAHPAILASCALPGIYPPVDIGGRTLVDGAVANNTAISVAVDAGADTIYVLPSGYPCALTAPPRSALGVLAHAAAILVHQRVVQDTAIYASDAHLVVLPPPCPIAVSATDFGHALKLIADARDTANRWLEQELGGAVGDPTATLGFHQH